VVVELGCGVGNTVFPLLKENPHLFFYALDFAPSAIELVKVPAPLTLDHEISVGYALTLWMRRFVVTVQSNPEYDESKCQAFVCDITEDAAWPSQIKDSSVDLVTMIFVLSAISPGEYLLIC
jgi:methyltransferase-like protein 6